MAQKKPRYIFSRILGVALLLSSVYMFIQEKEFKSSFETFNGTIQAHKEVTLDYLKVGLVGLIAFFYKEIRRYLDYVKYS